MKTVSVKYATKIAAEHEIFLHLIGCSDAFIPPLAERVNIAEYAKKIFERSVTFEAWSDRLLAGLLAAYFNNNGIVFITNVSVLNKFVGYGIASNLLEMCINHARKNNFQEISLEVHQENSNAIRFYKKFSFTTCETKGDILLLRKQIL